MKHCTRVFAVVLIDLVVEMKLIKVTRIARGWEVLVLKALIFLLKRTCAISKISPAMLFII